MRGQADKLIAASIRRATQKDLSVEESTETQRVGNKEMTGFGTPFSVESLNQGSSAFRSRVHEALFCTLLATRDHFASLFGPGIYQSTQSLSHSACQV